MPAQQRYRNTGFTIVELAVFLLVLGAVLAAIWSLCVATERAHVEAVKRASSVTEVEEAPNPGGFQPGLGLRYDPSAVPCAPFRTRPRR